MLTTTVTECSVDSAFISSSSRFCNLAFKYPRSVHDGMSMYGRLEDSWIKRLTGIGMFTENDTNETMRMSASRIYIIRIIQTYLTPLDTAARTS